VKIVKRFALLAALLMMWFGLPVQQPVRAQGSCTYLDPNMFTFSCAQTQTTCDNGCDQQYGYGTPKDESCRSTCAKSYSSCMNQNQQICNQDCETWCAGTTGATCCTYVDLSEGCSYSCGCQLPQPPCTGAVCDGTSWSCDSPILINVNGAGWDLTSPENGVWFDLADVGYPQKWSWTAAKIEDGFLALDRNGNGIIDNGTELFGSVTPQPPSDSPNGFKALAVFDEPENGGNGDGFIDAQDAVYSKLLLWIDSNHDGIAQPNELHSLREVGIARIDLLYQAKPWSDQYGNDFHFRSRVWDVHGMQSGRWAWDVYLHRDLK
jgi:hypothetical protein